MRKAYYAAHIYMILGLVSGLWYREFTNIKDFEGETQLSVMHTHLLALGMLFFLIVLALEKLFQLSESKLYNWFFWLYNGGLAVTVAIMFVHGTQQVLGSTTSEAISGIAGLGHIVLTVGLVLLFIGLGKRLKATGYQVSKTS